MKLLKIVFIVLILVTFAELSYYLYLNFYVKPSETRIINDRSLSINLTSNITRDNNLIALDKPEKTTERLINDEVINYLKSRPKNSGQKIQLIEEINGVINNIEKQDTQIVVHISDDKGFRIISLLFSLPLKSKSELSNFVVDKDGIRTQLANLDEIKTGLKIQKLAKIDLVDNSQSTIEYIIYDK